MLLGIVQGPDKRILLANLPAKIPTLFPDQSEILTEFACVPALIQTIWVAFGNLMNKIWSGPILGGGQYVAPLIDAFKDAYFAPDQGKSRHEGVQERCLQR
jgi:hypothetical protein